MRGIIQPSLFLRSPVISVVVPETNRYRILADNLPWLSMAEIANRQRAKSVDIHNGRPLNVRLHLGAYVAQSMNNWTDRETEDMVRCHGGVRILCGVEASDTDLDHTSIEDFRNVLGKEGAQQLNQLGV